MIDSLLVFLIATIASFFGSLQLGPVNSAVINLGLVGQVKAARRLILGGVIPESIYSTMALGITLLTQNHHYIAVTVRTLSGPILIIIALYFLYQSNQGSRTITHSYQHNGYITTGFIYGIMNLQLLTFWMLCTITLSSWFELSTAGLFSIVLGSMIGAGLALHLLLALTLRFKDRISKLITPQVVYRIVAGLLIILAIPLFSISFPFSAPSL